MIEDKLVTGDLISQFLLRLGRVRHVPRQENVQQNPKGPHICTRCVLFSVHDLGCHVKRCPGHDSFARDILLDTETEVDQFDTIVWFDHQVLRLNVAMVNVLCVTVGKRLDHLGKVVARLLFSELRALLVCDVSEKLLALHVLLHDVEEPVIVVRLVVLDDVRVV